MMAVEQTRGAGNSELAPLPKSSGKVWSETMTELRKTTWPTRPEAIRLTGIVVGVIAVLGAYMGALDAILTMLVTKFSLIK